MIYFDNAATTFPKPACMLHEMSTCVRTYCGNPGRSAHKMAIAAAQKIYDCRCEIASLFHSDSPENVIFTYNTTYALNIAIKTAVKAGDHILISNMEHNSVYRPVTMLKRSGIEYDIFNACEETPEAVIENIRQKRKPNTKLIITIHASNVCGIRLPIHEIGAYCRKQGLLYLVDAAQSAGLYDISLKEDGISILCAPGHKSLYGPQGVGFLLYEKPLPLLTTLIEGGNGVNSLDTAMPDFYPEHFEAGTLATPCIAGLLESIRSVKRAGIREIREHEVMLYRHLLEQLKSMKNIVIYAENYTDSSILLFNRTDIPANQLAMQLDETDICVRSGFHCSPLAHQFLRTSVDGAVRVSFGRYNTKKEVDFFCKILQNL